MKSTPGMKNNESKTMNAKQKEKIKRSLKNLDHKSQVYKQIDKALK